MSFLASPPGPLSKGEGELALPPGPLSKGEGELASPPSPLSKGEGEPVLSFIMSTTILSMPITKKERGVLSEAKSRVLWAYGVSHSP